MERLLDAMVAVLMNMNDKLLSSMQHSSSLSRIDGMHFTQQQCQWSDVRKMECEADGWM